MIHDEWFFLNAKAIQTLIKKAEYREIMGHPASYYWLLTVSVDNGKNDFIIRVNSGIFKDGDKIRVYYKEEAPNKVGFRIFELWDFLQKFIISLFLLGWFLLTFFSVKSRLTFPRFLSQTDGQI